MPVTTILLLRHGHRIAWSLDPTTGTYSSSVPFPTGLPADPPLASHGVRQSHETAAYLSDLLANEARQDRLRIYSSLFYRCVQTLKPTVESLRAVLGAAAHPALSSTANAEQPQVSPSNTILIRGETGIGEWFGHAWFRQPQPGTPEFLSQPRFFPGLLDNNYTPLITPSAYGERIHELHDRVGKALSKIIQDVSREFIDLGRENEQVTLLFCGHAAQIIAAGRALTGRTPEDWDEQDFKCYTCGISRFEWRSSVTGDKKDKTQLPAKNGDWRGFGDMGSWDCILNSWCGHLTQGEERGWHFHGDESFDSYGAGDGKVRIEDGGVDGTNSATTAERAVSKI